MDNLGQTCPQLLASCPSLTWDYCIDMKRALLFCLASLAVAPVSAADPAISTTLPVLRASLEDGTVRLRLSDGLLNARKPFDTAEITLVAKSEDGQVLYQSTTTVRRRATYAKVEVPQEALSAKTLIVRVK